MARINLLTDAPKHNLCLMKISSWHKMQGDTVILNEPLEPCDISYGSWLFHQRYETDFAGGPAVDPAIRLNGCFADLKPDYDLFPIDYSLGFTWEYCPRRCKFCCVPKQQPPKVHRSIWEFHDPRFKKICLLNNNTFSDPRWRETFEEIWEADLTVIDENGYDLRLIDGEKAEALKRTRFEGYLHFAWDRMGDEAKVFRGLRIARDHGLHARSMVYVLVGFETSIEQDIYRCQKIHDLDFDPFVMIYNEKSRPRSQFRRQAHLRRCINRWRGYRRYESIREAWEDYKG